MSVRTIRVRVTDEKYKRLVKKRKEAGQPTISALLLHGVDELDDDTAASEIAQRALARAQAKASGSEYLLRDLFDNWESYDLSVRRAAGKKFIAEVQSAVYGIREGRKSSAGHQYYVTA